MIAKLKFEVSISVEIDEADKDLSLAKEVFLADARENGSYLEAAKAIGGTFKEIEAGYFKIEYSKPLCWLLEVNIDTDDDAEVMYKGHSYCYYGERLRIYLKFESPEKAIEHMDKEIKVIYGRKASELTADWLEESKSKLRKGEQPDSIGGNQTFSMSLTEVNTWPK